MQLNVRSAQPSANSKRILIPVPGVMQSGCSIFAAFQGRVSIIKDERLTLRNLDSNTIRNALHSLESNTFDTVCNETKHSESTLLQTKRICSLSYCLATARQIREPFSTPLLSTSSNRAPLENVAGVAGSFSLEAQHLHTNRHQK
jgi:hypothetical protein